MAKATPMDVTLVSRSGLPEGSRDELVLARALHEPGAATRIAAWDDPAVDWAAGGLTVLRSCWNYHTDPAAWLAWLDRAEATCRIVNPVELVRWNQNKLYLAELQQRGLPVVPTIVASTSSVGRACEQIAGLGWNKVVTKPTVGAASAGVSVLHEPLAGGIERYATAVGHACEFLVQPYQEAVESERERSLVFIAASFSHAFTKPAFDPGGGDGTERFRTQRPSADELKVAGLVLDSLARRPAYARIDLAPSPAGPLLMECELIEPDLLLRSNPAGTRHLAEHLCSLVRTGERG